MGSIHYAMNCMAQWFSWIHAAKVRKDVWLTKKIEKKNRR